MKQCFRFAAFAVVVTVLCGTALAQGPWSPNLPTATLKQNGQDPNVIDAFGHTVKVAVPGQCDTHIDTGGNAFSGIIMIASLLTPTGAVFATPFGGSLDIGTFSLPLPVNITILANGIFPTSPLDYFYVTTGPTPSNPNTYFDQIFTANQLLCGGHVAFQAVVFDPTNAPLPFNMTEAVNCSFLSGQEVVFVGSNLFSNTGQTILPLVHSFPYYGINYTQISISDNGEVFFNGVNGLWHNGFLIDPIGFIGANPAIAAFDANWDPQNAGPNDGVHIVEAGTSLTVTWGDGGTIAMPSGAAGMAHWNGLLPLPSDQNNTFSVEMELNDAGDPCVAFNPNAGNITINEISLNFAPPLQPGQGMLGIAPGGLSWPGATAYSSDLAGQFNIGAPNQQIIEEDDPGFNNLDLIGWDGFGSRRLVNYFQDKNFMSFTFFPFTFVTPGDGGYVEIPSGAPLDIVTGQSTTSAGQNLGTVVTLYGKFFGYNAGPGGSVTWTDSLSNSITVGGVLTGSATPPLTNLYTNEGLVTVEPNGLATGFGSITVNYGSGATATVSIFISNPCQVVNFFTNTTDDGSILVNLTATTITMYGVNYTTMYCNADSYLSFLNNSGDYWSQTYSQTMADFFDNTTWAGGGTGMGPIVACAWFDKDSPFSPGIASYSVIEDTCLSTITYTATGETAWQTGAPLGNLSVTFNSLGDSGMMDFSQTLNDTAIGYGNPITGISLGDSTALTQDDFATFGTPGLENNLPYFSANSPASAGEQMLGTNYATRLQTLNGGTGILNWAIFGGFLALF